MKRTLSESAGLKVVATLVAVATFVWLYEATTSDSREAARTQTQDDASLPVGTPLSFRATAYCKGTTTASGVAVRTGIVAADPAVLPVGSVVNLKTDLEQYNGIYTVMDTGPKVRGRTVDVYIWSCYEALDFGRRNVEVTVLRLGWNPAASSPGLVDRLFRQREAASRQNTQPGPPPVPDEALSEVAEPQGAGESEGSPDESVLPDAQPGRVDSGEELEAHAD